LPPYEPLVDGMDMEGMPRSTVVAVEPPPPPPPPRTPPWDVPLCWCLTDSPLCLPQSRDSKVLGDYGRALSYGSTAKYLNLTALLLNIFLVILVIILLATGTITMINILQQQQHQQE
ncbi:IFM1 protein, partial [Jacana jacana]|nr:IFM1 protein [Jacana jacana]